MYERRERILPFIIISLFYTAVTSVFYHRTEVSLNDNFIKFLIVINLLVLVCTLVTLFYKVSVHTVGLWGIIGILVTLNQVNETSALFYPLIIAIIVAGAVMSARLKLQVHSLQEILVGAGLGLMTSVASMSVLFRY